MSRKKRSSTSSIKWTLPSLVLGLIAVLGYELIQQFAFPVIVQEQAQISLQACFTPSHRCQTRLVSFIEKAEKEILVMCYSFTAEALAQALIKAQARGVAVHVIADKSQLTTPYSQIPRLAENGIDVFIERNVAIAHNKVFILDNKLTITGSYNFSNAAERKNAENLVFIESTELAKQYKKNWLTRRDQSTVLPRHSRSVSELAVHSGKMPAF